MLKIPSSVTDDRQNRGSHRADSLMVEVVFVPPACLQLGLLTSSERSQLAAPEHAVSVRELPHSGALSFLGCGCIATLEALVDVTTRNHVGVHATWEEEYGVDPEYKAFNEFFSRDPDAPQFEGAYAAAYDDMSYLESAGQYMDPNMVAGGYINQGFE
ncbi:hypothetical protein HaLaN_02072, partial [Haematococcus lacustris]